MCHNYWACALEPWDWNYWAQKLQAQKPAHLKPMLNHQRSHCNEKPPHLNIEFPPVSATSKKPMQQQRPSTSKNKQIIFKNKNNLNNTDTNMKSSKMIYPYNKILM